MITLATVSPLEVAGVAAIAFFAVIVLAALIGGLEAFRILFGGSRDEGDNDKEVARLAREAKEAKMEEQRAALRVRYLKKAKASKTHTDALETEENTLLS